MALQILFLSLFLKSHLAHFTWQSAIPQMFWRIQEIIIMLPPLTTWLLCFIYQGCGGKSCCLHNIPQMLTEVKNNIMHFTSVLLQIMKILMPLGPTNRCGVMCQVYLVVAVGSAALRMILRPAPKGRNAHLKLQWLFSFVSI